MNSHAKTLEFGRSVWMNLIRELRRRGGGKRESGAFLLGNVQNDKKVIRSCVFYDDLDPTSLRYDYVHIDTQAFSLLWSMCKERGVEVLGDVHTHPGMPNQSSSDRAHPMICVAGHTALIVPGFAVGEITPTDISVNVYLGSGRWKSYVGSRAASLIKLTEGS